MAERPRELGDFKKARVNGGTNNHPLKGILHSYNRNKCKKTAVYTNVNGDM